MRIEAYATEFRARTLALIAAGALVLSGCSSPESLPETTPTDATVLLVEEGALPFEDDMTPIDMKSISESIASAYASKESPYQTLEQTHPDTGEVVYDLPASASAPVLTINLENDQLTYEDSTPGLITAEQKLLSAVKDQSGLLEGAMRRGILDSVEFRVFESKNETGIEESAYPVFLSQDRNNTLYYFLPVDNPIDTEVVTIMTGHEASHAALNHVMDKPALSEAQVRVLKEACGTLKKSALEDLQVFGSSVLISLGELWHNAPKELKPYYERVIRAMSHGTYDQLPVNIKQYNIVF